MEVTRGPRQGGAGDTAAAQELDLRAFPVPRIPAVWA